MVGEAGIEPTTPGLEGRCSIRLSYSPGIAMNPLRTVRDGEIDPSRMFATLLQRGYLFEPDVPLMYSQSFRTLD